jgi:DNA repair exonuclease SbcCD ATPase subunit
MLTGRQALGTIEQALMDLRREEAELNNRIDRSTRSLADLQTRQSEAYKDLARFRLDNHAAETLDSRLDKAAREAGRLLEKRAHDHKLLTEQLREKETARTDLQDRRARLADDREAAAGRMDELMETVDTMLENDETFLAQKQKAEAAAQTAEAAAAKARTSAEDRLEKGKAYEADRLFMYLWERGFGTPAYDRRGIIRSLDRWVAGLINYHDARANYAMLTGIPERMAKHAEHCAEEADIEAEKLAALSRKAMTDTAGEDLAGRIDEVTDRIMSIDAELEGLDQSADTLSEALQEYAKGQDENYIKAEEALSKSLKADDLRDLWREALDTPSPDDEKIVRQIEDLVQRMEQAGRDIRQDRELQRDISRRRAELTKVTQNFRRSGYDNWDSTFSDDSLTTVLLGELVKGAISGADYWSRAKRSHKRRRPRGGRVGFRHGTGLPKSMGGGFSGRGLGGNDKRGGGGFGGGGFKSGGGFGGGGFKTGDTF